MQLFDISRTDSSDIDIEQPNAMQVDFADIFQFIANTPALALQGNGFVEDIRRITNAMQALCHDNRRAENMLRAKEDLRLLLGNIAPHLAEYTGAGIEQYEFNAFTRDFLAHFHLRELPLAPRMSCLEWFSSPRVSLPALAMFVFFVCFLAAAICSGDSEEFYDDDMRHGLNVTRHYHNDYSEEQRERLKEIGISLFAVGSASIVLLVVLAFFFSYYNSCARAVYAQLDNERMAIRQANAEIRTIQSAVSQLHSNHCRRNHEVFYESHLQESPRYFYELAAKLYADRRGDQQVVDIFRTFIETNTPDGQQLNRLVREASPHNLILCLESLVNIPMNNARLAAGSTLKADIFEVNVVSRLLHLIGGPLRESLGLKPWDLVDYADSDVLTEAIAIAQYTGESSTSVYTASSSSAMPFFSHDLRALGVVTVNPLVSNVRTTEAGRIRTNSYW